MMQIQPALFMASLLVLIGVNPIFLLGYDQGLQELICLKSYPQILFAERVM